MKIACDMDGVICDPHTFWFERLSKLINRKVLHSEITGYHKIAQCLGLTDEEVMSHYTPDIYEQCKPEKGAVEGVNELSEFSEIVIVSRTDYNFDETKIEWLNKYFPNIPMEIRFSREGENKSNYLGDCDFFIDDFEENFYEVDAECLLYDQPWNRHTSLGFRVKGWREVVDRIKLTKR